MNIEIKWVDPLQKILVWRFQGTWTLEQFRESTRETQAIADELDHHFSLIFDLQQGKTPRFPMAEVQRAFKIPVLKRDLLLIVTKDLFIRSLLTVLPRLGVPNMAMERFGVVGNMADAYKQIEKRLAPKDAVYQQALDTLAPYDDAFGKPNTHHQRK